MKVSAQFAQEHFDDILNAAASGEVVEIALPDKPALFLAPHPSEPFVPNTPSGRPRRELLYAGEGVIPLPTDEEWKAMDKELEAEMLKGPIFPPEHF